MNSRNLLVLFLTCLLLTLIANATAFDALQKQLQSEINRSTTQNKTINSTTKKTNNAVKKTVSNSITEISILDNISSGQFQSWDDMYSGLSEDMKVINDDILFKCKVITKQQASLTVDYKLHFNKNVLQKITIVKSSGYKDADDLVIDTLRNYFKKYAPDSLNNGKPFVFIGRIRTIPFAEYSPVYILKDDLETVPTEHKDYFAKFSTLWEESYKNSNNAEGEALILLKISKNGNLISTDQTELIKEFNKLYKYDLKLPEMPQSMVSEIILSAQSLFPIEPLEIEYNQVIVMKTFKATKTPFIKPTDKVITKIGKGALVGLGTIIAIPFVVLGAIVSGS